MLSQSEASSGPRTKGVQIYKKTVLLRCIHHFKNNNMDHMRISGTEPSSVILSQTSKFEEIVVPRPATNLTLGKVKGQGQGHCMVPIERACHNDHAYQVSMLYH